MVGVGYSVGFILTITHVGCYYEVNHPALRSRLNSPLERESMTKFDPCLFLSPQPIYDIITNSSIIMAMIYVSDETIAKVIATGKDKQKYVKEAIEKKLKLEN